MFRINAGACASRVLSLLAVVQFIVQVTGTAANAAPTPQEVHFKRGESFAILQGTLKGWDLKEYSLRANKGQRLRLQVTSRRINWLIVRLYPANQASGGNDLLNGDNTNTFGVGRAAADQRRIRAQTVHPASEGAPRRQRGLSRQARD